MEYAAFGQYFNGLDPCLMKGFILLIAHRKYLRQLCLKCHGYVSLLAEYAIMLNAQYGYNIIHPLFHCSVLYKFLKYFCLFAFSVWAYLKFHAPGCSSLSFCFLL